MWPFSKIKSAKQEAEYEAMKAYWNNELASGEITRMQQQTLAQQAYKEYLTDLDRRTEQRRIGTIMHLHRDELIDYLKEKYPEDFL